MPFIINSYNFAAATPSFSYVLDDYPTNVAAGYSVRKLRSSYTGACMKIRRSSDNTLQDIGFVDNYLDVQAIADFCGGSDGQVHTWYDQVEQNGVSKDWVNTSTTSTQQPIIYSGGSVETFGTQGKAALRFFDGINASSLSYSNTISTGTTSSRVIFGLNVIENVAATKSYMLWARNTNYGTYLIYPISGSSSTSIGNNVGSRLYFRNNQSQFTGTTAGQLWTYLGGQDKFVLSVTNLNFTTMNSAPPNNLLTPIAGDIAFNGHMNEVLVYHASGETLSNIVTNINNYYGIF
jgi:hypothetical protein